MGKRAFAMPPRQLSAILMLSALGGGASAYGMGEALRPDGMTFTVGLLAVAGSTLVGLGMGILTLFMTRREIEAHHGELGRRVTNLETNARSDIAALHEKINRVDRCLASVEAETGAQSKMLADQSAKLDALLGRK